MSYLEYYDEYKNIVRTNYLEPNDDIVKYLVKGSLLYDFYYSQDYESLNETIEKLKPYYKQSIINLLYEEIPNYNKTFTPEYRKNILSKNGFLLRLIKNKTLELCHIAIKDHGLALFYVPKEIINEDLCYKAVYSNSLALSYVPKEIINKELCKIAVEDNGLALEYVPKKFIDKELCKIAIKNNPKSLKYIDDDILDNELIVLAVKKDGLCLSFLVPLDIKMWNEICDIAYQQNYKSIIYNPHASIHEWIETLKKDLILYKHCKIDFDFKLLFDNVITKKFTLNDIRNDYYSINYDKYDRYQNNVNVNFNRILYYEQYSPNVSHYPKYKYLNCCNLLKRYYIERSCGSIVCLDCFKKYLKITNQENIVFFLNCNNYDCKYDCKYNCPNKFSLLINDNVE